MIDAFFWFIGSYNLMGAVVMACCVSEKFGDLLLGRYLQIVVRPYRHGEHGPLWVWCASLMTAFLGLLNLMALRWPDNARGDLALGDVFAYGTMLIPVFAGLRSSRYVKAGLWACIVLWLAQIGWAVEVWRRLSA